MMRLVSAALAAGGLCVLAAPADAADAGVQVEHAAARIVVVSQARRDVSVSIRQGDPRLPPLVAHQDGATVVVDGGLQRRRIDCVGISTTNVFGSGVHLVDHGRVRVDGVGVIDFNSLPVVTAYVPLDAAVGASGAVWGQVGPSARLSVANAGCGDWTVADVGGPLAIELAGSGDLAGGRAGSLQARVAGSGDVRLGDVGGGAELGLAGSGDVRAGRIGGGLRASLAGSGDVRVVSVDGPVKAHIAASGDVIIDGGHAQNVAVDIAGSGDFTFRGRADALSASVVGSGDVQVAHVSGPVSRSVIGSGEITAGR